MISRSIPVHAVSSTGTARAVPVTAKPARPRKRTPMPAAVDQQIARREIITAAARAGQTSDFLLTLSIKEQDLMDRHPEVPDLLEEYMKSSGTQECWVTVRELRSYFDLDDSAGPAILGFLQRIHYGNFFSFQNKVGRNREIP